MLKQLEPMLMQIDPLAIATLIVVVVISSMRLLHGAWPWEAGKTWYRTRPAVEYVAKLRSVNRQPMLQQLASVDTSKLQQLASVDTSKLQQLAGVDTSNDSFDRNRIVRDNSLANEGLATAVVPLKTENLKKTLRKLKESDRPAAKPQEEGPAVVTSPP